MSDKPLECLITDPINPVEHSISQLFDEIDNSDDKSLPTDDFFWFSKLSEYSFSDSIWQDYINTRSLKHEHRNFYVRTISNLKILFNQLGYNAFRFIVRRSSIISITCLLLVSMFFPKYPLRFLINLINELLGCLFVKNNVQFSGVNSRVVFYCDYPSNWDIYNSTYRFTGGINFAECNASPVYLISFSNTFDAFIRNPFKIRRNLNILIKSGVPFIPLQYYVSLRSIFLAYIQSFSALHLRSVIHSCDSLKMHRYFYQILLRSIFVDYPKQRSMFLSSYGFFKSAKNIRSLFLPVFELNESRAIVRGAKLSSNNIHVIGIQHGSIGRWASIRYCAVTSYLYRNHKSFVPDSFLQEGELTNKMFRERSMPTQIVGAPRLRRIYKYAQSNAASNACLILLDLHFWKVLLDSVCAYSSLCSDMQFIIRAHPKSLKSVISYLHNKVIPSNITFDTTAQLSSLLHSVSPRAVIAGPTGGLLDFALSQYPCFLFSSIKSYEMNPLSLNSDRIMRIYDDSESWSLFKNIFHDIPDVYIKHITADAYEHVNCYGTSADQLLYQMIISNI